MTEATVPARNPPTRPVLGVLWLMGLFVFSILFFAMGLASGVEGENVWILATALLTGAIALVPLAVDQGRDAKSRHLIIGLLSLSFLIHFVVPVFARYFGMEPYSGTRNSLTNILPSDILAGQVVALLALASMLSAYALPAGRFFSSAFPQAKRDWSHQDALLAAVVMIPLAWLIFGAGLFGLIPRRLGTVVLAAFGMWIYFGFALLTITYLRYRSRPALLLMFTLLPPTMAISFFIGSKKFFLASLVVMALAHILVTGRIRMRWVLGGILAIAILYPLSTFYRDVVTAGQTIHPLEILRNPGTAISQMSGFIATADLGHYMRQGFYSTSGRLSALGILSVIVRDTPEFVPFQGGWSIGYIPLSWVPRIFWPGKPDMSIGKWVTNNYGGPDVISDTGPSWVGELFFNFGYPGVIIGMAVLGIYFRVLHESIFTPNRTIPAMLAGVIVLWTTAPNLQGALTGPINGCLLNLGPIFLLHFLMVKFGSTVINPVAQSEQAPSPRGATVAVASRGYLT